MRSGFTLGMLLSQVALCAVLVASAVDAVRAHGELAETQARQKLNDDLIAKVDAQLDALARGTQALAQSGDGNAAAVVTALAQSGVRINARAGAR